MTPALTTLPYRHVLTLPTEPGAVRLAREPPNRPSRSGASAHATRRWARRC